MNDTEIAFACRLAKELEITRTVVLNGRHHQIVMIDRDNMTVGIVPIDQPDAEWTTLTWREVEPGLR